MVTPALLLVVLLLFFPGTVTQKNGQDSVFELVVVNRILNTANTTYLMTAVTRGILLGAMKRLEASNADFKFTVTEDLNYGPYLESVNGVFGNDADHTYWQLLGQSVDGNITRANVGIGCYIPKHKEMIILNYTSWCRVNSSCKLIGLWDQCTN